MSGRTSGRTGKPPQERFNLQRSKEMVLQALADKVTHKFKMFCKSELMDRFLNASLAYFHAFFKLHHLQNDMKLMSERDEEKQHAAELECHARLKDVAAIYATILIKNSNYAKTQQERQFFETLYDFTARVLFTSYDRRLWHDIENELGRIFRSSHFNLAERKNEQSTQKPLKYKELYALRHEVDPVLHRPPQVDKPRRGSIHAAMHMRSPIVSTIFPTPKERMAMSMREKLLEHRSKTFAAAPAARDARDTVDDSGGSSRADGEHTPSGSKEGSRSFKQQPQSENATAENEMYYDNPFEEGEASMGEMEEGSPISSGAGTRPLGETGEAMESTGEMPQTPMD